MNLWRKIFDQFLDDSISNEAQKSGNSVLAAAEVSQNRRRPGRPKKRRYFGARKEGILALPNKRPKKNPRKWHAGPGRGHKGPMSNLRLSPMQMNIDQEQIKTEPIPVQYENNAEIGSNNLVLSLVERATKMENYEAFSLSDETLFSALKKLADKMKLLFLFYNPTQNQWFFNLIKNAIFFFSF